MDEDNEVMTEETAAIIHALIALSDSRATKENTITFKCGEDRDSPEEIERRLNEFFKTNIERIKQRDSK